MGPPSIPTCARLYPIYHGSSVQCRRISAYRHFSGSLFPVFASRDGTAHLIRSGPINRGCGAYRPITLHYGIGLSPPPSSPPPPTPRAAVSPPVSPILPSIHVSPYDSHSLLRHSPGCGVMLGVLSACFLATEFCDWSCVSIYPCVVSVCLVCFLLYPSCIAL